MTCDMKELFVARVTFRHFSIYHFPHTTLAQNDVRIRICPIQFLSVLDRRLVLYIKPKIILLNYYV